MPHHASITDEAVDQARASLSSALQRLRSLAPSRHGLTDLGRTTTTTTTNGSSRIVNVPAQVEWHELAGQRFAQLALTTFIEWRGVAQALHESYSPADGEGPPPTTKLAGDYGLDLVLRVLRRFQKFEFDDDKRACIKWCATLEKMVEREIEDCQNGWSSSTTSDNAASRNGQRIPSAATTPHDLTTPSIKPPHAIPQAPKPTHIAHYLGSVEPPSSSATPTANGSGGAHHQSLSVKTDFSSPLRAAKRNASGADLDKFSNANPSTTEISTKHQRLGISSNGDTEDEINGQLPSSEGKVAISPPPSSKQARDELAVSSIVIAKGLEGKKESMWCPGVVFDPLAVSTTATPILGKRSPSSFLIALLGTDEWHWVPPSRLKSATADRLDRLERDLEQKLPGSSRSGQIVQVALQKQLDIVRLAQDKRSVKEWIQARKFGGVDWALRKDDPKAWLTSVPNSGAAAGDKTAEEKEVEEKQKEKSASQSQNESQSEGASRVCSCRQIWREDAESQPVLIGCESGESCRGFEWYHPSCVGLDERRLPDEWYCPQCRKSQ